MTSREPRSIQTAAGRCYELLVEIGSGGMGKVYLGRALGMAGFERYVAIKRCHPHLSEDEEFSAMFLDEARIAARIHHPNVVPTLDLGESDGLFLVMEYVEGDRLSQLIRGAKKSGAPVPVPIALRIAIDVLSGLQAAHELCDAAGKPLHIVHRDVTPQNIILGVDGVSRILDFGIASAASRATTTKEGHVKGKLGYLPPEQLAMKDAGPSTDVYALGVVLWETLAGARLFRGATDALTIAQIMAGHVPPLPDMRPDVPALLDDLLGRALHRDLAVRFPSAAAFAVALESSGLPIASARTVAAYAQTHFGPALADRKAKLRAVQGVDAGDSNVRGPFPPPASDAPAIGDVPSLRSERWPSQRPAVRRVGRNGWLALAALGVAALGAWWFAARTGEEASVPATAEPSPAAAAAPTERQSKETPPQPSEVTVQDIPARDAGADAPNAEATRPALSAPRAARRKRKERVPSAPRDGEWWPGRL